MSNSSSPTQLRSALDEFAQHCSAVGGVTPDPCFNAWSDDSLLETGVAISPQAAAHCVADYRRSVIYLRAVNRAIHDALLRFPDKPTRILYSGCGPYATLLLPLLHQFEPGELQIFLLDIHEESLQSVHELVQHFDLSAHDITLVHTDACHYQHPQSLHIIIVETMQKALEQEPQVAITAQLAPQLCAEGIFIPQKIEVKLVLHSARQQYPLTTVFTLNSAAAIDLTPLQLQIPRLPELESLAAELSTDIHVYAEYYLQGQDAEITLPRPFPELAPLNAGQRWQLQYRTGPYPCFEAQTING